MKKALFIIFMTLCILLCSCGVGNALSCTDILAEVLAVSGENTDGNGVLYFFGSESGEIGYLSREEKALIYGESRVKQLFDENKIEDYAMFFSSRGVGEIAIFKCYSKDDTKEVARMCLERADEIKVLLRKSEWREKSEGIKVIISKKYVLMVFAENAEKVEKRFKNLI